MSIQTVCFDLDDTLYSYEEYAREGLHSAATLLEDVTGDSYYDELHELYFDENLTEGTFDRLVEKEDIADELVPDLVSAFHSSTAPLPPYPETEQVLFSLSSSHKLGLITDGREGKAKLDRLGIGDYFDSVLVTPTIDCSKEERIVFDRVLDSLDTPPTKAVYVGDDPRVDFRVPNKLGMYTVRLCRGRYTHLDPDAALAEPDCRIQALSDLPPMVQEFSADC